MSFKEHLQFFVLMIPTLLLVIAAIVTLVAPPANARAHEAAAAEPQVQLALGVIETEATPLNAVATR